MSWNKNEPTFLKYTDSYTGFQLLQMDHNRRDVTFLFLY